jgi:hypothetical protein
MGSSEPIGSKHLIENFLLIRERKSNAGRPPFDCILLFKIIILQRLYSRQQ